MQIRAIAKSVRMSPRKLRLIADTVRNLSINQAFEVLEATQKRASMPIFKALKSAVANAKQNNDLDVQNLIISSVMVNEGQALKRFHPSSRGRVHPYKKRSSHIVVVLKEKAADVSLVKVSEPVKSEVTKDKKKSTAEVKKGGKK